MVLVPSSPVFSIYIVFPVNIQNLVYPSKSLSYNKYNS